MDRASLTRRAFLRLLAALGLGTQAWLVGCDSGDEGVPVPSPALPAGPPVFRLPERAGRVLARALERLIPSDDGPGATEAGVLAYVEKALGSAPWDAAREAILGWVPHLDRIAARDWAVAGFAEAPDEAADRVLEFVQSGLADEGGLDGRGLLHDLLILALEGFLGDPGHGGNAGCAGWRYIGYFPGEPRPGHCGHREGE